MNIKWGQKNSRLTKSLLEGKSDYIVDKYGPLLSIIHHIDTYHNKRDGFYRIQGYVKWDELTNLSEATFGSAVVELAQESYKPVLYISQWNWEV